MKKLNLNKEKDSRLWLHQYGNKSANLEYPPGSMIDALMNEAQKYPEYYAYEYFGKKITYRTFMNQIENTARALKNYGVQPNDVVAICMPTTPEALIMVYAVNLIGAVNCMIHPLSGEKEIENYLNQTKAAFMLTLDLVLTKILNIKKNTNLQKIIVAPVTTSMPSLKAQLYKLINFKKRCIIPKDNEQIVLWPKFINNATHFEGEVHVARKAEDLAVILFSGGTTGTPKGIMLNNLAFNAIAYGGKEMVERVLPGSSGLSILPIFHGFGLAICVHTPLICSMKCVLIPLFHAKNFGALLKKHKPNYIVGVPSIYESLLKQKLKKKDLECVETVISGGDVLTLQLKKKIDNYLKEHGSQARVRNGYGLTEATAATCLSKPEAEIDGGIGYPFPDTYFKIIKMGTLEDAPLLEDGEICISGPTVMMGYLNNQKETNEVLRYHQDGRLWLHTGDIGYMLKDGTVVFKQRLKRIIISGGYNIYPSYIENVILTHPAVLACTVIGVPHSIKGQVVKACIVLKKENKATGELKKEIQDLCLKNISKYAIPYYYEYRNHLPTTLVGKVAFKKLETEHQTPNKNKN